MPSPSTSLDDLGDYARKRFIRFVVDHGTMRTVNKTIAAAEAMTDDGDCWSAAWRYAQAHGGTYVEGSCLLPRDAEHPHNRVVRAHSWVEISHPLLGPTIVELTRGYETAIRYRGVPVDCTPGGDVDRPPRAGTRPSALR